jgi:hypothetical protein
VSGAGRVDAPSGANGAGPAPLDRGGILAEIEARKARLLGRPFLRAVEVAAARADLHAGVFETPGALADAADRMLRGERSEDPSLEGL